MTQLKTFGIWFLLGAGLLVSGLVAVSVLREFRGNAELSETLILLAVFAISGGGFAGIVALAIRRVVEPNGSLGAALHGEALQLHAARLGVSLQHTHDDNGHLLESELQRRVFEMEKAFRERRGFVVAVGAAVVSAFSALAAWLVHLK